MGERMSVFEKLAPHCLYVPAESDWDAVATTDCVLAVCTAPGKPGRKAQRLGPEGLTFDTRGQGANTRNIFNIAMEGRDVADSLLVTEVFTPQGNWSSYPPHRHDEDNFPDMTYLEETYYHRLNPSQGYGIQRVFTEDGSLDETMAVSDGDVVLVPKGHHPCGAPYGYEMYYLNVMAGPIRKWRFKTTPTTTGFTNATIHQYKTSPGFPGLVSVGQSFKIIDRTGRCNKTLLPLVSCSPSTGNGCT